jgi:hypothetical protein
MVALSNTKDKQGVIVIGYLPINDIKALIKMFNVKSTIYDTREAATTKAVP